MVAGTITGLAGLALDQITEDDAGASVTPRESFLVVALLWLLIPIGALPYILDGGPQLSPRWTRTRGGVRFTATGATLVPRIEDPRPVDAVLAQAQHWLAAWASSCWRSRSCRACGSAVGSCCSPSSPARRRSRSSGETIRETARRLWRLYVILTLIAILTLGFLGWSGLDDQ